MKKRMLENQDLLSSSNSLEGNEISAKIEKTSKPKRGSQKVSKPKPKARARKQQIRNEVIRDIKEKEGLANSRPKRSLNSKSQPKKGT